MTIEIRETVQDGLIDRRGDVRPVSFHVVLYDDTIRWLQTLYELTEDTGAREIVLEDDDGDWRDAAWLPLVGIDPSTTEMHVNCAGCVYWTAVLREADGTLVRIASAPYRIDDLRRQADAKGAA